MTNKAKGDAYEKYICGELNSEENKIAWLWNNIPLRELRQCGIIYSNNAHRLERKNTDELNDQMDLGCDILLKENNEYKIVQCKNYTKNSISIDKLGGFFNLMMQYQLKGLLYYTSRLSSKLKKTYNGQFYQAIFKPFYEQIELDVDIKCKYTNIIANMYPYQIYAYNSIKENLNPRCILQMPCGLGKTIVAMKLGLDYDQVIFISPLRQYCKQNISRFKYEISYLGYETLLIDADGTRDINQISDFIKTHKKLVLSVCFKSVDVFNSIKQHLSNYIVIIDEFHNITKDDITESSEMNKLFKSDDKILFISATPKILTFNTTETSKKIFGKIAYSYDMGNAIKKKYICDYDIYIPKITLNPIDDILEEIDIHNFDQSIITKLKFLINGCCEIGVRKCIIYLQTKAAAEEYVKAIKTLNEFYSIGIWSDYIVSDDSAKSRNNKINNFISTDKLALFCAVHILDECIDIPECDSVFLTYPSQSKIKNIQRICRANRIDKKNQSKRSSIFVWADENDDLVELIGHLKEYDESFSFGKVNIMDFISDKNILLEKNSTNEENKILYDDLEKFIIGVKKLEQKDNRWETKRQILFFFCSKYFKTPSRKEFLDPTDGIGLWYENQKRKIVSKDDYIYLKLAENPIVKENIDNYIKETIRKTENLTNSNFEDKVKYLFEFANINKRSPFQNEKYTVTNTNAVISIGSFLHDQLHHKHIQIGNDKYNKLIQNEYIKKRIDEFFKSKEMNKVNISSEEKKKLLFEYVDIYKYTPNQKIIYKNVNIGQWFQDQKRNIYSNNSPKYIELCENKIIKDTLDDYIAIREKNTKNMPEQNKINDKISIKKIYENTYKKLLEYINTNKSLPNRKDNCEISRWLYDRAKTLKSTEEKIYKEFYDNKIVLDYFDSFIKKNNNTQFKENKIEPKQPKKAIEKQPKEDNPKPKKDDTNMSKSESIKLLIEYCNKYNKCPLSSEKYENYSLGKFLSHLKLNDIESSDSPIYKQLSIYPVIKENLDKYIETKNKKITFDDALQLCIEFVNETNNVPNINTVYKNYPLGKWYSQQKKEIKNKSDKKYICLSTNQLIKVNIDKIFSKRNKTNEI